MSRNRLKPEGPACSRRLGNAQHLQPAGAANLKTFKRKLRKVPLLPIAAGFDEGIDDFKRLIREAVAKAQRAGA
jgi:hypothetical protein